MMVYEWQKGKWLRVAHTVKHRARLLLMSPKPRVMTTDQGIIRETTPYEEYMIGTDIQYWNQ